MVDSCTYSHISKVLLSTYGNSLSLCIEVVNISGCIRDCRTPNYRLDPKHLGPLTPSLGYLLCCPHSGLTPDWPLPKVPLQCHPAGRNFPIRYLSLLPTANPKPRWSDPMPSISSSTFLTLRVRSSAQALCVAWWPESDKSQDRYRQKKCLHGQPDQMSQTQPHAVTLMSAMPPAPGKQSRSIPLWAHIILFLCCASPLRAANGH